MYSSSRPPPIVSLNATDDTGTRITRTGCVTAAGTSSPSSGADLGLVSATPGSFIYTAFVHTYRAP